jgi:hypothetical protein
MKDKNEEEKIPSVLNHEEAYIKDENSSLLEEH